MFWGGGRRVSAHGGGGVWSNGGDEVGEGGEGKLEWQKSAFHHPPASLPLHEKARLKGQQDWLGSPSGPQGTHGAERGGQANKGRDNASSPQGAGTSGGR